MGAVLIAVIAGIGLGGCGRKSGLDPPPVAAPPIDQRADTMQPAVVPDGIAGGQPPASALPPPRGTWLDWLIN